MKELTPEEMTQVAGGLRQQGPLAVLFDRLGRILNDLFPPKRSPAE